MSATEKDEQSYFLNVDLDIYAPFPLEKLVTAFGSDVLVLRVGKEVRRHGAHLELSLSGANPDRLIQHFVRLVKALPRSQRATWNQATRRQFNVGIQGGLTPAVYELTLKPETLAAAGSVLADLVITVYAARRSEPDPA